MADMRFHETLMRPLADQNNGSGLTASLLLERSDDQRRAAGHILQCSEAYATLIQGEIDKLNQGRISSRQALAQISIYAGYLLQVGEAREAEEFIAI